MRPFIYLIIVMLLCCSAQAQKVKCFRADSIDHRPILLVNKKRVEALSLFFLNKEDFETLEVLSPQQAIKRFGKDGKYGAVEISLFKDRKIFSWPEVLHIFHYQASLISLKTVFESFDLGVALMPFADARRVISSVNKINGIQIKKIREGETMHVYVEEAYADYKAPKVISRFDKKIDSITRIFQFEAVERGSASAY